MLISVQNTRAIMSDPSVSCVATSHRRKSIRALAEGLLAECSGHGSTRDLKHLLTDGL